MPFLRMAIPPLGLLEPTGQNSYFSDVPEPSLFYLCSFAGADRILRAARRLEPFLFGVEPRELRPLLEARGLELLDDVAGREFAERFFAPRRRRLFASEYEHVALARIRE